MTRYSHMRGGRGPSLPAVLAIVAGSWLLAKLMQRGRDRVGRRPLRAPRIRRMRAPTFAGRGGSFGGGGASGRW